MKKKGRPMMEQPLSQLAAMALNAAPSETRQQTRNIQAPADSADPSLAIGPHAAKRLGISRHSVIEYQGRPVSRLRGGWDSAVETAGLATDDPRQKVVRHTLRHTAISWYLAKGVDIETVSLYCGVSVATIRKVYRHAMPGTFDSIMDAAHHFGR